MLKTKNKKYSHLIKTLSILSFIVAVLLLSAWYLNVKTRPILNQRIKSLLYKSTDSLYTINFSSVDFNLLTGSANLKNVEIKPDTLRYHQLIQLKRAPNNLYTVKLKKISIKHFHPLTLYLDGKLSINELLFDKPSITMVNKHLDFNEDRPMRPIKSPYQYISKNLTAFNIQLISFKDISFKYINKNVTKPEVFTIDDLNIHLKDLLIDSTSAEDPTRFYLLKDIDVNLKNYSYPTPDKLYTIDLNELKFNAKSGKLNVKTFRVNPLYEEMKFGQVAGYNKDRYSINLSNLDIHNVDLAHYISKQELWATALDISTGKIEVFSNDKLLNKTEENKIGRYPNQLLQKLNSGIILQKINIKDVDISYAVYDKDSEQTGKITFLKTSGQIFNVTNLPKIKALNPICEANLSTYLMGQGKLNVNFKFDLQAPNGAFNFDGELGSFNARVLNRVTVPLGMVRINHGEVNSLKFNFSATDLEAKGSVRFDYLDLAVSLLKNDPTKDHLVKRGLLSFLANALMIKSQNPAYNEKLKSEYVSYKRLPNTSFFNLIWRSLFTGIKYSVGITEEKTQEMQQKINLFKSIQQSRKSRQLKRQITEQKR
ncbi:hypothetical protein [Pedobacter sp. MW01-1-1]|uniref:hypothetical protein n=1 Tax=Pedobacter sp. MW01-1-1 TaxID=3383027 RepID=UPI003FF05614